MLNPLPLSTERLVLREVRDTDLADLLVYYRDADVARYVPWEPLDEDGVRARIERFRPSTEAGGRRGRRRRSRPVIELEGRVVGDLMLRLKGGPGPRTVAELGWTLNPAYTGRGVAAEGARALIDLAFGELGCHRVFANLDAENGASARLCERLGMTREAFHRQDYWMKGAWTDSLIYALLRDDWAGRG